MQAGIAFFSPQERIKRLSYSTEFFLGSLGGAKHGLLAEDERWSGRNESRARGKKSFDFQAYFVRVRVLSWLSYVRSPVSPPYFVRIPICATDRQRCVYISKINQLSIGLSMGFTQNRGDLSSHFSILSFAISTTKCPFHSKRLRSMTSLTLFPSPEMQPPPVFHPCKISQLDDPPTKLNFPFPGVFPAREPFTSCKPTPVSPPCTPTPPQLSPPHMS
jgi:hypothetical protein